jgi:hypothetical protein
MPGAQCTRSRACSVESTRVSHHGRTGKSPGIPARDGFNGFLRALPSDRACLPLSSADTSANLTPASGRQDHTTSPSADSAFRLARCRVHRIPCPTSVTIAIRPSCGTGWREFYIRFDFGKTEIFLRARLDRAEAQSAVDLPVGQTMRIFHRYSGHRQRVRARRGPMTGSA